MVVHPAACTHRTGHDVDRHPCGGRPALQASSVTARGGGTGVPARTLMNSPVVRGSSLSQGYRGPRRAGRGWRTCRSATGWSIRSGPGSLGVACRHAMGRRKRCTPRSRCYALEGVFSRASQQVQARADAGGAGPPPAARHGRGRTARAASCSAGPQSDGWVPMPPDHRPCRWGRSSATEPTSPTGSSLRRG